MLVQLNPTELLAMLNNAVFKDQPLKLNAGRLSEGQQWYYFRVKEQFLTKYGLSGPHKIFPFIDGHFIILPENDDIWRILPKRIQLAVEQFGLPEFDNGRLRFGEVFLDQNAVITHNGFPISDYDLCLIGWPSGFVCTKPPMTEEKWIQKQESHTELWWGRHRYLGNPMFQETRQDTPERSREARLPYYCKQMQAHFTRPYSKAIFFRMHGLYYGQIGSKRVRGTIEELLAWSIQN